MAEILTLDPAIWSSGMVFGLSAGVAPGPLLTLVVSETLKHGIGAGVRVALAPLLSDAPIITASILLLSRLSDMKSILGAVSLIGAGFIIYLAWESLIFKGGAGAPMAEKPPSLRKGVIANLLNPSPYLFWATIGGPIIIKASAASWLPVSWFIFSFYLLLVGSKVTLAVVVGKSREFLNSRIYIVLVRAMGFCLFVFAAMFLRDGLAYLGILALPKP